MGWGHVGCRQGERTRPTEATYRPGDQRADMDRQRAIAIVLVLLMFFSSIAYAIASL